MGKDTRRTRRRKVAAAAGVIAVLAAAGSASAAFQALPPGDQVNNDRAAGINPNLPVNLDDPANSDVVGGSLVASKPLVPWAIFRQRETTGSSPPADQIFSRSFATMNPLASGVWTTRGNGTVGGRSSASPTFSGSLNFDQSQDGEAPAIDFAGTGRTVPWATWYEHVTGIPGTFGANNIFASRFDATSNKWIFSGQGRGNGGGGPQVPSLNIHTDQSAENPSVAGGSAVDPTAPGPWVTWQETTILPVSGKDQIFVSKPLGPGRTNCVGVTPAAEDPNAAPPGGFCFQQTGLPRVGPGANDPSLNVDPTRNGIEPDIAFTGPKDSVPWVVWYETGPTTLAGPLHSNEMVFAARGITDSTAQGGFHWQAVGSGLQGVLDKTGTTNHFGTCAESATNEEQCSLNKNPAQEAEDPRVAAGTMTHGNPTVPTVPWVVWDEGSATTPNNNSVFVARLVGAGAAARFVIANNGQPIGTGDRADITFSGNTPYVTWHHNNQVVTGHFTTPDAFVKDNAPVGSNAPDTVRAPISSGCIADPFSQDGAACQAGAVGTPFFLFTDGTASNAKLFADAYQADNLVTGPAKSVTASSATLTGSVNPEGAAVNASFQFGTTTAYGGTTTPHKIGVTQLADVVQRRHRAACPPEPRSTTGPWRRATSRRRSSAADRTFKTAAAFGNVKVGKARVSGTSAFVRVSCSGVAGLTCKLRFRMTVTEKLRGTKIIAITASKRPKIRKVVVTVGSARCSDAGRRSLEGREGLAERPRQAPAREPPHADGNAGRHADPRRRTVADAVAEGDVQGAEAQEVGPLQEPGRRRPGPRPCSDGARAFALQ